MIQKIFSGITILGLLGCAYNGDTMELEGRLAMKGSSSHSYMSIKDTKKNKSYKIKNAAYFDLIAKQGQSVKLKVKLVKEAIGISFPGVVEVIEVD